MDPKLLTEGGLKSVLSKHKIKDNGLQKALAAYDKLDDDAHDDCLETIAQIGKLAAALKKAKDVAANKAVLEYLEDLLDAANSEEKGVAKDRAAAEKSEAADQKKAQKEKEKEEEEEEDEDEDDEEEEMTGEYGDRLLTAFKKLKTMNGKPMKFVVCDARPFCGLAIGKRVGPKQKEELTKLTGGSKRFLKPAICFWDGDQYVFEPEQVAPGLAKRLVRAVKNFTGKKFRIVVGDETAGGDDEEEEGDETEGQETEAKRPEGAEAGMEIGRMPGRIPKPENVTVPDSPQVEPPLTGINPDLRPPNAPQVDVEPPLNMTAPFSISGSVGRGGKNKKEDIQAVQAALNRRANAGLKVDGVIGPKTLAAISAFQKSLGLPVADGLIEPGKRTAQGLAGAAQQAPQGGAGIGQPGARGGPPRVVAPPVLGKAELGKAPDVWHGTREILKTTIDGLKKMVLSHYGDGHPELVKEIDTNLGKLDAVLNALDHRLADSLKKAHSARDEGARKAELKTSKAILVDYIKYVKTEPMIAHIDANPFGLQTNLKKILSDSLTNMAQSIGN